VIVLAAVASVTYLAILIAVRALPDEFLHKLSAAQTRYAPRIGTA
jgi:hypothetical protein